MNNVDILNVMMMMTEMQYLKRVDSKSVKDSKRVKSQKELRTPEQSEYLIKKAEEKRARRAKR